MKTYLTSPLFVRRSLFSIIPPGQSSQRPWVRSAPEDDRGNCESRKSPDERLEGTRGLHSGRVRLPGGGELLRVAARALSGCLHLVSWLVLSDLCSGDYRGGRGPGASGVAYPRRPFPLCACQVSSRYGPSCFTRFAVWPGLGELLLGVVAELRLRTFLQIGPDLSYLCELHQEKVCVLTGQCTG